ncbi:MAG: ECF transporter S component [Lachnospiraceae bacterium]|nr:ECF transporter S component [Lachnospiraceae bacterium]
MRRSFDLEAYEKAGKKRTLIIAFIVILLIPATIAIGVVAGQRGYMIVSTLILFYVMVPFFLVYERRKPKAREIVMIAVLSALAAFGSLISASVMPFQMGTAMVIISGISFGPEAGFLVGALGRFVVNFFQGQGPWTPWQMFCWGLLGFLAGLVFNKIDAEKVAERNFKVIMGPVLCVCASVVVAYISFLLFPNGEETFFGWRLYIFGAVGLLIGVLLQHKRLPVDDITLTAYTFFSVFILYGGIINVCALVTGSMYPGGYELNWDMMKALYISGVPFDAIHAVKASVFIFFFGEKMIRKFERIKIKYGFYR